MSKVSCTVTVAHILSCVTLPFPPHYCPRYHPCLCSLNKATHPCLLAFALLCLLDAHSPDFHVAVLLFLQISLKRPLLREVFLLILTIGTSPTLPPTNSVFIITQSIALLSTFWNDIAYLFVDSYRLSCPWEREPCVSCLPQDSQGWEQCLD